MTKSVLALAFEAGIRPFDTVPNVNEMGKMEDIADKLLHERNPYFSEPIRRKFGTQVHAIEVFHDRMVLGAVESALLPNTEGDRIYRAVLFRADGEVIYQTPDNRRLDLHAAVVDLKYQGSHVDEGRILHALCVAQIKKSMREREAAEKVMMLLRSNPDQAP